MQLDSKVKEFGRWDGKIMSGKQYFLQFHTLLLYLIVVGTLNSHTSFAESSSQQCTKEVWVTVFVHGIMSIKSHLTLSSFFRFMQDQMHDTIYAKTVDLMRQDPFFYQNQAMQEYGLRKAELNGRAQGNSSYAMGWLFDVFQNETGNPNITSHYYTFGWSGLLSCKQRYLDSIQFFEELEREVHKFKIEGIEPKVRVIGYSHGGNVALNLAMARRTQFPQSLLKVDELLLVGMPVQKETDYLINDPLFKQVYHFYSGSDFVQRLDVFCKDRYLSNRIFTSRKGFTLPCKLTQIQIKVTRPIVNLMENPERIHSESGSKKCCTVGQRKHHLRNDSPGHIELWFFGWTPHHYRDSYTFSPLPTMAIAPYILHHIKNLPCQAKPYHPILVDIRPYHENIVIKQKHCGKKIVTQIPFIAKEKFEQLKRDICQFAPCEFNDELYRAHMATAYNEAVLYYEQKAGLKKEIGSGWLTTRKRYSKNKTNSICKEVPLTTPELPEKNIHLSYFKF